MRFFAGKVLILLAIAMALANARCFSHCLVQPCCDQGKLPPCHSHGKSNSANCAHHNDLTAAATAPASPVDESPFILVSLAGIELEASTHLVSAEDPSPPWFFAISSAQPLRI